jgi:integrase
MFYKKLQNGKVKFYDTYLTLKGNRRQVSVTMNTSSSQSHREARKRIELKISQKLSEEKNADDLLHNATCRQVFEKYWLIREKEIAATSAQQEKNNFKTFFDNFGFGDKRIKKIESLELQNFVSFFSSTTTQKTYKRILVQFFDFAFQMRYIDINEAARIRLPRQKVTFEAIQKRENKFFTVEEFREFVEGAKLYIANIHTNYQRETAERKLLLVEFLFWTGLRFGEAVGLLWENVDFLKQDIFICHSWSADLHALGPTKNVQSIRHVSLNDRSVEILEEMKRRVRESEFIFITTGMKPFSNSNLNAFMKKVGVKAEISGKIASDFSAHMLRHSHITLLVMLGIPQKVIMDRVGHSNPRTTSDIYTHVLKSQKDEVAWKLNDLKLLA